MLIHVDPGVPSGADGSTPELRAAAAATMREELAKSLGRRGWSTRHVEERLEMEGKPGVFLVSVELEVVDAGNKAVAKSAHVVRTVSEPSPVVSNAAREIRHDNAAFGSIHYELRHGNQVVHAGNDEDHDIDGLEDVMKRLAIDMADPLTKRAREVD